MRKKNYRPVLFLINDVKIQNRIIQCNYSQNPNRWGFFIVSLFDFFELDKLILKFVQTCKRLRISKKL